MAARGPVLVVFGGLPGTGKTVIAKALAAKRSAVYVRIDAIEHALLQISGSGSDIGSAGYVVAFAMAASNLKLGTLVVADCVNPVRESRRGWRDVVHGIDGAALVEIEVVCSDQAEHRRRVEERAADIDGFMLPSWASVVDHAYMPWTEPRLVLDTAVLSIDGAVAIIESRIAAVTATAVPLA